MSINLNFRQQVVSLVLIILGTYLFSLGNDFILGDDYDQIVLNPLVHNFDISAIFAGSTYYLEANQSDYGLFYRPLMLLVYSFIYQFFGPNPMVFHLVSLLGHSLNSILVLVLFRRILPRTSSVLVYFAAVIFAIHPLNSEVVLHSANLQEILFVGFGLLSLLLLGQNILKMGQLILGSGLIFVSLLSKETGLLFGLMSIIYAWQLKTNHKIKVLAAVFVPSLVYVYFRFFWLDIGHQTSLISQIMQLGLSERLTQVPIVVAYYLLKFFAPVSLSVHQFWVYPGDYVRIIAASLFIIILLGLAAKINSLLKLSKSPQLQNFSFFGIWLVVGVAIHSQIIPLYLTVADRWFYAPMIGLLGIIVIVADYYQIIYKKYFNLGALIILITLISLSFTRSLEWANSKTLFESDINSRRQNYFVANMLASVYIQDSNYDVAEPLLVSSVKQFPFSGNLSNLATVLAHQGDFEQAFEYFQLSLARQVTYQTVVNYANSAYYLANKPELAIEIITTYLDRYPYSGDLYLTLAQAYYVIGEAELALTSAQTANHLMQSNFSQYVLTQITQGKELDVGDFIQY